MNNGRNMLLTSHIAWELSSIFWKFHLPSYRSLFLCTCVSNISIQSHNESNLLISSYFDFTISYILLIRLNEFFTRNFTSHQRYLSIIFCTKRNSKHPIEQTVSIYSTKTLYNLSNRDILAKSFKKKLKHILGY